MRIYYNTTIFKLIENKLIWRKQTNDNIVSFWDQLNKYTYQDDV